jgi:hypothetical protein
VPQNTLPPTTAAAISMASPTAEPLPDPLRFDPVHFPGTTPDEVWPPARFDFETAWLREPGLGFERDAGGAIGVVRPFSHMRMIADLETAHRQFDIAPGTRDFRLLRLVPAALRCVERIEYGAPVPAALSNNELDIPEDAPLFKASSALMERLAKSAGEEGLALAQAMRRIPPGPGSLERAVAHCITEYGFPMAIMAPLARRLQKLADAHARVLFVAETQPDYAAMERMLRRTKDTLSADRRWAGDLLTRALDALLAQITLPRQTAEALLARAEAAMRRPGAVASPMRVIAEQAYIRDRLLDLAVFWRRLATAWLAVDPTTTDRREIEALARNGLRRLALAPLYNLATPDA